jgi:O-antigen ligase/tetratricopeptide (TPR) repeat protein
MSRNISTKTVSGMYLFLLMFSPVAFGSVEMWSMAIMETASVTALLIYFFVKNRKDGLWREVPGLVPLLLLLSVMALQLIPLPGYLLSFISPNSFKVYSNTIGIVDINFWAPVSIDQRATLFEFMRFTSYTAFYITGIQLMIDKNRMRFYAKSVVLFAMGIAFISIIHKFTSSELILWLRDAPPGSKYFGPYVSKNHFAGYMGMVFPLSLGLFMVYRPRASGLGILETLKATAGYKRIHKYLLFGFSSLLIATSVAVSLSRGGLISLCGALVIMMVLLSRKNVSKGMAFGLMLALVVLFVGWFGWEPIIERFGSLVKGSSDIELNRFITWQDTIRIIKDYPIFGTGFGTFGSIYPAYRTFYGRLVIDHAHNDYLELLANGGLVSFVLVMFFVIAVFMKIFKALWIRREPYSITMGIAGITAVAYILMHSLVDFNLQIGANGLYFFFLMAYSVSVTHTKLRNSSQRSLLQKVQLKKNGMVLISVCVLSTFIILINISTYSASILKGNHFLALRLDPFNSEYSLAQAMEGTGKDEASFDLYKRAVMLSPTSSRAVQALAVYIDNKGDALKAKELMRSSLLYGKRHRDKHINFASWLINKGMYIEAEEIIREAISDEPEQISRYAAILSGMGLEGPEILSALPAEPEHYIKLAKYFYNSGEEMLADDTYWRALDYLIDGESLSSNGYKLIYMHFLKMKRYDAQLLIAEHAVLDYPHDAEFIFRLALAYEKLGRRDEALLKYDESLAINPGNKWARRRLEILTGQSR